MQRFERAAYLLLLDHSTDQLIVLGDLMPLGWCEVRLSNHDQVHTRHDEDIVVPSPEGGISILRNLGPLIRGVIPPQVSVRLVKFLRRRD